MLNFKITDGDIVMDGQNNIVTVDGDDEFLQCIQEILKTNAGEWFLDDNNGFARFEVLGKKYDEENAINLLTEAIFQDERVEKVENIVLDFDRKSRKLAIKFEIMKLTGETVRGEVVV